MSLHRKIFFLLLALLPTQLGYHFWPAWTIVLGRKIDYLSPTIYLTDVLIACLLIAWLLEAFSRITNTESRIRNSGDARSSIRIRYSVFIILFVFINIWFAKSASVATYTWVKGIEFFLLGWYVHRTRITLSWMVVPLAIGVLYSSLIAIAQFCLQHSLGGPFWLFGERTLWIDTPGIARISICNPLTSSCVLRLRAYGTFPHPNVLGGYLAIVLPVIIQFTNNTNNKLPNIKKYFFLATIVVGLIALALSFSRGAWIVTALGVGVLFYRTSMRGSQSFSKGMRLGMFLIILLCICLAILFRPQLHDESIVVRQLLNQSAWNMWRDTPFIGVGLGNFLNTLPHYVSPLGKVVLQPVHNIYLLLLSEIGLMGIIGLIGLLWKRITFSMPLAALLLLGLIDHYSLTLQQGQLLFTIFIALMM